MAAPRLEEILWRRKKMLKQQSVKHGGVNPMTMDSSGYNPTSLGHRHSEHKIQKLPQPLARSSRQPTTLLLLTATDGQEDKSSKRGIAT
jgi:hypothetical protein